MDAASEGAAGPAPSVAVSVTPPGAIPVTFPKKLTRARVSWLLPQVTAVEKSVGGDMQVGAELLRVAFARSCRSLPTATLAVPGVTWMSRTVDATPCTTQASCPSVPVVDEVRRPWVARRIAVSLPTIRNDWRIGPLNPTHPDRPPVAGRARLVPARHDAVCSA